MSEKVIDRSGWNYTIIDNDIIETDKLTIYEKMIYIALKRFANIQTQEAFPGVKKVAEYARMSERKARDVLGILSEKELIHIEHRENNTSIYTILKVPAWCAGGAHGAGGHARHAGGVMHDMHHPPARGADELKKLELKKEELKKLKDTPKRDKRVYEETSNEYQIAIFFVSAIRKNNPDFKQPNMQKWSDTIRLMIERDNRTEAQIRTLIEYVQTDDFEMANVLGPDKLRKRFDQLRIKWQKRNQHHQKSKIARAQQQQPNYTPAQEDNWRNPALDLEED